MFCTLHIVIYCDEIRLFYREVTQVGNVFNSTPSGLHWRPNYCVILHIVGKNHQKSFNLWQERCMEVPRILRWEGYAFGVSTSYYNPLRDGVCQFFAVKESFSPLGFLVNHAIFRAERYVLFLKNGVLDWFWINEIMIMFKWAY